MPAISSSSAPSIALAVARPPDARTSLSSLPWMTSVGAVTARRRFVRSPEAMIAASWRPPAAGLRPRSNVVRELPQVGLVALEAGRADQRERLHRVLDVAVAIFRRDAEQRFRGAQGRLPGEPRPGVAHDRDEREHALGMRHRQRLGDHRPHRGAHDVRALDAEMVEQPGDVTGHVLERVARSVLVAAQQLPDGRDGVLVQPRRASDVAVVEPHDEEAARGQPLAERVAPRDHLRAQAHDQDERRIRAVTERLVAQLQLADGGELLATCQRAHRSELSQRPCSSPP
jgi:hypothetical protein